MAFCRTIGKFYIYNCQKTILFLAWVQLKLLIDVHKDEKKAWIFFQHWGRSVMKTTVTIHTEKPQEMRYHIGGYMWKESAKITSIFKLFFWNYTKTLRAALSGTKTHFWNVNIWRWKNTGQELCFCVRFSMSEGTFSNKITVILCFSCRFRWNVLCVIHFLAQAVLNFV